MQDTLSELLTTQLARFESGGIMAGSAREATLLVTELGGTLSITSGMDLAATNYYIQLLILRKLTDSK